MMVELSMQKSDAWWCWQPYGGYDVWGMTWLIEFGIPHVGVITHRISSRTWGICTGKLTRIRNSLKVLVSHHDFHFLLSSSIFLILNCTITWEHHSKSSLTISPCHDHELTQTTPYTKYSIHSRLTVSPSFPQLRVDPWMLLQLPACLPRNTPPPSSSPWELKGKFNLSHSDSCKLTNLWILHIFGWTTSKYSPVSLNHGLQVCIIMASELHLQTRSIMPSKFSWSWPASTSLNSINLDPQRASLCCLHRQLQAHLQLLSSTPCS